MVFEIKLQTKPSNPQWAGELLESIAYAMWFFGLALPVLVWFIFALILNDGILGIYYTLGTYIWLSIPFMIFWVGSKDLGSL